MVEVRPDPCPLSGAVTLTLDGRVSREGVAHPHTVAGLDVGCLAEDGRGHESFAVVCIVQGQGSAGNPKDQISDGVGVGIGATPAHRFTRGRAHPDHTFLAPCLSDAEGVVHVGRPVATVGVKGAPC